MSRAPVVHLRRAGLLWKAAVPTDDGHLPQVLYGLTLDHIERRVRRYVQRRERFRDPDTWATLDARIARLERELLDVEAPA